MSENTDVHSDMESNNHSTADGDQIQFDKHLQKTDVDKVIVTTEIRDGNTKSVLKETMEDLQEKQDEEKQVEVEEKQVEVEENKGEETEVGSKEKQDGEKEEKVKESMECEGTEITNIEIKDAEKSSVLPAEGALAYRVDASRDDEGTSDDSDDSSSSSSSDSEIEMKKEISDRDEDDEDDKPGKKKKGVFGIRTRGELFPEELPPLEELKISVDEAVEMKQIGTVASIVGVLVVIQANKEIPALNEETVLFTEKREAFGKIFEVFGPVVSPFYSVRFNSLEDITTKNIIVGQQVFCAPKEEQFTQFVFVEQLKRIKGSDASWENNNEPPSSCLDFSDDDDEKKTKSKNRNRAPVEGDTDEQTVNRKDRNRMKKARPEKNGGTNQEQHKPGGQRGGHGRPKWPPRQMDSWPPRGNMPGCPPPYENRGDWEPQQPPQSFISPGSFRGNRGQRHQGPHQRFQNPFIQSGMRPQRPRFNQHFQEEQYVGGFSQGGHFEQGNHYNGSNNNPLIDTRLVQNPNHNGDVPHFRMERPQMPRTTFGGQPHFNPGPSGGQYGHRPGMPGQYSNGGPQGRW